MKDANSAGISVKADAKAGTLMITLPFKTPPKPSSTGKTLIVAGTDGAVETSVKVNDKLVILNVNAYVYATDKGGAAGSAE